MGGLRLTETAARDNPEATTGLTGEQPVKVTPTLGYDEHGRPYGRIGTSIPGADTVDLKALFDRADRLADLNNQRTTQNARLQALTSHPWSTHRTT